MCCCSMENEWGVREHSTNRSHGGLWKMGIDSASLAQLKCVGDGVAVNIAGTWVTMGSVRRGSGVSSCRRAEQEL